MNSKKWAFSCWRNADNDSADVTSACKFFQIRGLTTAKARMATVDMFHRRRHHRVYFTAIWLISETMKQDERITTYEIMSVKNYIPANLFPEAYSDAELCTKTVLLPDVRQLWDPYGASTLASKSKSTRSRRRLFVDSTGDKKSKVDFDIKSMASIEDYAQSE